MAKVKVVLETTAVDPDFPGKTIEDYLAYVARVSNPANQELNANPHRLIKHCLEEKHWSVFETAYITLQLDTNLGVAPQLLRHRSFTFQQFSQRYAKPDALKVDCEIPQARRQDTKNRQSTHDDLPDQLKAEWERRAGEVAALAKSTYDWAVGQGIGKECARFVLPTMTPTRLYMTGNVRSWIHYVQTRCAPDVQLEHRRLAEEIRSVLAGRLPIIASVLGWQ